MLEFARARGIPVPAVEACDQEGEVAGVPCGILADVGGAALTGSEPVFGQVGTHLRSLHENVAMGFGPVSAGDDLVGENSSWRQALEQPAVALPGAADVGLVEFRLLNSARPPV